MKMKRSYTPDLFEDSVLHWQWVLLLAKALERDDEIDPVDDLTLPELENIVKRLKHIPANFNDLSFHRAISRVMSLPKSQNPLIQ